MAEMLEKGIVFTFDEVRILLHAMEITEIEGIYMPEKIFREDEIIRAMHHMSGAGIIEAREEKFQIRDDIRQILEIMSKPEQAGVWKPEREDGQAFFVYWKKEQVVVSERFWRKKEALKLTVFKKENFEKWREDVQSDNCGN